jgi:DNA-binding transcriptional LysR family regulator
MLYMNDKTVYDSLKKEGVQMELRVLEYFLAVAREENMTAAAQVLHVSQPTLSRQMMDLERELGKTLFLRTNRQTMLTEDGMRFRKRAEEIVSLVERTEYEFKTDSTDITGELHIGAAETDVMRVLAEVMTQLHQQHPLIKFNIYSANADDVTEKLERGLLDFGLMIEPVNKAKYEYIRLPQYNVMGILMRKDSPLARKEVVTPADLQGVPLLASSRRHNNFLPDFAAWLGTDGEKLNIVATFNLLYNASLMVESGLGYAVCINNLANTSAESPLCFRPLSPEIQSRLVLVWKKYQLLSKAEQVFLARVREKLRG